LHGLVAFGVVQRRRELGIRVALGARRSAVVRLVLGEALTLVAAGLLIGLPAAWILGRFAASRMPALLFGLNPADPSSIAFALAALTVVAAVAAYLPARSAGRTDPVLVLRAE